MSLQLVGGFGSPYSRKMRALLRYRRIPFRWVLRGGPDDRDLPQPPVRLIPVLIFAYEDGSSDAMIDSTPQIRRLEEEYEGRSVVPSDPALAFLDFLVEDYADEWLTKAMFHYRWWRQADIDKASHVLPLDRDPTLAPEALAEAARYISERQVGRLGVVGSNVTTRPIIEASYLRLLAILDERLQAGPFLFGARPSASDFGLFGQLSQLVLFDPTPVALCEERAPRVIAWAHWTEDLGWLEPGDEGWLGRDEAAALLRPLLAEIGRVYAPFLLANAEALLAGAEEVLCTIDGAEWRQAPFPYQGKCLQWLRGAYAKLDAGDRAWVDGALVGT
ncbi:MAG: glutathione S-transferase, partial [Thermoanaerobaculia bacterium]|nr:glutathione S-transferase [Thermoanaerobaculia bacterium]